jgi:hypothetical protein
MLRVDVEGHAVAARATTPRVAQQVAERDVPHAGDRSGARRDDPARLDARAGSPRAIAIPANARPQVTSAAA